MRWTLAAFLVAFLFSTTAGAGENWPAFRGKDGTGTSDAKNLPTRFSDDRNVKWKIPIHGRGWSSPVVWGNQIWLTTATRNGKQMFAVCVDRDSGKIVHNIPLFANSKPRFCHPTNTYASPTCAIEPGQVYCHFGSYGTACVSTKTGKILWTRRDFVSDDFRGPASSPVIHNQLLFLTFDGVDFQFVVAINKMTGKNVWKMDRDIDYGTDNGDAKKAYGTPVVINAGGREQLISPAAMATIAYDPANGNEIWRVRHGGMNVAARPLFGHGLLYISAGSGNRHLIAVKPTGKGNITKSHIQWSTGKAVPRRSCQLLIGNLYFMMNDKGVASCLNAKTGKRHWQKRIGGKFWASPVYGDGKIYCFSDDGRIPVIRASDKYELLATNKLETGFNATAAIVGRALILRTKKHLYRIEK